MASLASTFNLLAKTDNEAAASVLIGALDASQREIRELALGAVLDRKHQTTELNILRRWPDLSERWKQQIADRPGWLSRAIRAVVVNREPVLFQSACAAAVYTRDYESVSPLVAAAIDPTNFYSDGAAITTLELAERLADELASPRDYRLRRDPQLQRGHVLVALEKATEHSSSLHARKLIEAFLLLANRDNATLNRILHSPADPAHKYVADVLSCSTRSTVESLLLSYLDDPHAPHSAIEIIARRSDLSFIRLLTRKIASGPTPVEKANLKRITSIAWLSNKLNLFDALRDAEQPGAIHLVMESALPDADALRALGYLLRHGKVVARRQAASALASFSGPAANDLAVQLLEDDDPQVRANVACQLRGRNIPGAIQRLSEFLESPHAEEREAAQASLKEFTLDHFAAIFDQLSPEARAASGALVRRVDPEAVERLRGELTNTPRGRKHRAIELAVALGAVDVVLGEIAALLADEDQYIRLEAVRALATQDCRATRDALRDALLDSHPLVRQAAEAALLQLTRGDTVKLTADAVSDTVPSPSAAKSSPFIPGSSIPTAAPEPAVEFSP